MARLRPALWYFILVSLDLVGNWRCCHCMAAHYKTRAEAEEGSLVLYVSMAGDDHWSGRGAIPNEARTDGPLASVNQAALLSKAHKDVAVTVVIEEGRYYLSSSLNLDSSFSRSADTPLTFSGCPRGADKLQVHTNATFPLLSGGLRLKNYQRTKDGDYMIYLPKEHLGVPVTQLFVNGQREPVARKPNTGYMYWKSPLAPCNKVPLSSDGASPDWRAVARDSACPDIDRYGFVFNEGDISQGWENPSDAWILVFAAWSATWHHIKSVDYHNNTVMFKEPSNYAVGDFVEPSGRRYYVENVLEELDAEGEWYYNKTEGFIVYRPRGESHVDAAEPEFIIPLQQNVISASNLQNVNFECLSIQHSLEGADNRQAYHTVEAAVHLLNCSNIQLSQLDIQHTGASCISLQHSCEHINVELSRSADCGGDGIAMDETSSHVAIQNNIVNTTGFIYMMQPTGIRAQGQHNITVEHNEVLNVPYAATMFGWQAGYPWKPKPDKDHYVFSVRYNYLHHYGLGILNDFGGVYVSALVNCWQLPPQAKRPSCNMAALVEQNIIHDAECFNYGADGIYTDENAEGVDLASNLIYDIQSTGVYFHCGVNLTSTNDFVINTGTGGHRGAVSGCNTGGFSKPLPMYGIYLRNIFYIISNASQLVTPRTQLDNSTFNYNLYCDTSKALVFPNNTDFQKWQAGGQDKDSKIADPKFVSVKQRNFRLTADSPAHTMGIAAIDIDNVGPKSNPFATRPLLPAWTPLVALQRPGRTKVPAHGL